MYPSTFAINDQGIDPAWTQYLPAVSPPGGEQGEYLNRAAGVQPAPRSDNLTANHSLSQRSADSSMPLTTSATPLVPPLLRRIQQDSPISRRQSTSDHVLDSHSPYAPLQPGREQHRVTGSVRPVRRNWSSGQGGFACRIPGCPVAHSTRLECRRCETANHLQGQCPFCDVWLSPRTDNFQRHVSTLHPEARGDIEFADYRVNPAPAGTSAASSQLSSSSSRAMFMPPSDRLYSHASSAYIPQYPLYGDMHPLRPSSASWTVSSGQSSWLNEGGRAQRPLAHTSAQLAHSQAQHQANRAMARTEESRRSTRPRLVPLPPDIVVAIDPRLLGQLTSLLQQQGTMFMPTSVRIVRSPSSEITILQMASRRPARRQTTWGDRPSSLDPGSSYAARPEHEGVQDGLLSIDEAVVRTGETFEQPYNQPNAYPALRGQNNTLHIPYPSELNIDRTLGG